MTSDLGQRLALGHGVCKCAGNGNGLIRIPGVQTLYLRGL